MKHDTQPIDPHSLRVLDFAQVREILASYSASSLGRNEAMALAPSTRSEWVAGRIAETTEFRRILDGGIRVPMAGLRDIAPLLDIQSSPLEPDALIEIAATLAAGSAIRVFFDNLKMDTPCLDALADQIATFDEITSAISRCIDRDGTICDEASPRLRDTRQQIARLNSHIRRRFNAIVSDPKLRAALENDNFVTRNNRPVIAVKKSHRSWIRGIVLDRSNTGATLYIEPPELIELANELEDALFDEQKEITRILWELTRLVLAHRDDILHTVAVLAQIDLTYAKARFSIAYDMSAPAISGDGVLRLRNARHPLLMYMALQPQPGRQSATLTAVMEQVVPIDVRLGDDFSLLILTGPNTGGKTVSVKTIGLLTLMAQSGMHICAAAESQVPVFAQVFADIGDEQSIQQSLSTFSAHMAQIVRILKTADDRSLVLLDELGAGTDPAEGAALATAILEQLRQRGASTVATTHLGSLKIYAYTTVGVENGSVEFDTESLRPTYRLFIGQPGSSNALAIAGRLGMPESVTENARSAMSSESTEQTELINRIQQARIAAEQRRAEAAELMEQADKVKADAEQVLAAARQERATALQQANRQIDRSMTEVRRIVSDSLKTLQNAPKPWAQEASDLARRIEMAAQSTTIAQQRAKFVDSVRTGDHVYIIGLQQDGIVRRIRRKRRTMTLTVQSKQVEVPFEHIIEPPAQA